MIHSIVLGFFEILWEWFDSGKLLQLAFFTSRYGIRFSHIDTCDSVHCSWLSPVYLGILQLGAFPLLLVFCYGPLKSRPPPGRHERSCTHLCGRPDL